MINTTLSRIHAKHFPVRDEYDRFELPTIRGQRNCFIEVVFRFYDASRRIKALFDGGGITSRERNRNKTGKREKREGEGARERERDRERKKEEKKNLLTISDVSTRLCMHFFSSSDIVAVAF